MWAWVKENGTGLLAIAAVLTLLFNVVNARIDTKFEAMNQRFDDLIQTRTSALMPLTSVWTA